MSPKIAFWTVWAELNHGNKQHETRSSGPVCSCLRCVVFFLSFSGVHWCLIWCSLFAFQCIILAMECGKNVWLVYLIPGSMHHSCSGRLGQCPGWRPWRSDRDSMCINHPFMVAFMFVLKNEYNNFWIYKWERCGSRCGQNKLWYLAYHIVDGSVLHMMLVDYYFIYLYELSGYSLLVIHTWHDNCWLFLRVGQRVVSCMQITNT